VNQICNKNLTKCKQIARQLHTQYVDGINSILVTLKSRLRVTIQKLWNGFLFTFHFGDIQRQRMA